MFTKKNRNKDEKFRKIELSDEEIDELYNGKGFSCTGGFALLFLIVIVIILLFFGLNYYSMRFDIDLLDFFR